MQFIRSSTLLAATILSAVSLVSVPAANAQTPAPNAQTQSTAIPDQKLDATANALQQVTDVRRTYEEKLSAASGEEQQRIVKEANDAMDKAVTDHGASLAEFELDHPGGAERSRHSREDPAARAAKAELKKQDGEREKPRGIPRGFCYGRRHRHRNSRSGCSSRVAGQ